MATVKKMVKKAQRGKEVTPKGFVRGEMTGKLYKKEVMDKWDKGVSESLDKASKYAPKKAAKPKLKAGGAVKKAKSGGSFPDLNKDGKVTKADILKGRGVIAKKGAKVSAMKKCKYGCK